MRQFVLGEYETKAFTADDAVFAPALTGTGMVTATLTVDGRLRLTANSVVGVLQVPTGDEPVELRVKPKLPIDRLFWMLTHARTEEGWRSEPADLQSVDDFVPALAVAFTAATSRALAGGLLQGYRSAEESLTTLRGRLREGDQLRRRLGMAPPLEVRYEDYSVDIPENQILLAATELLRRTPDVPATAQRELHRLARAFADVARLIPGAPLPQVSQGRLNSRYRPALRLAELALARHGTEHHAGGTQASGFTFNLNTVFEDWLTAVLRSAITIRDGGTIVAQHPTPLDEAVIVTMNPDITWWRNGTCLGVADAKYKKTGGSSPPNADLYQMLAYCAALGLREGHLVYATNHLPLREYELTNSGVRVLAHGLDLAAPLGDLRQQIDRIAHRLTQGHLAG